MSQPLILDGKACAKAVRTQLKKRVATIVEHSSRIPVLATILASDDPASETYVKMKASACRKIGMASKTLNLGSKCTTRDVLGVIMDLNRDPDVHGILLQHPMSKDVDERVCFDSILPGKDVDGVTSLGFGRLSLGCPAFVSATPGGIMYLLDYYGMEIEGKNAVVVGRSPILGKPMACMLINRNATVTVCHSRTENVEEHIRRADLVVAAVGKKEFIKSDWIKPGAIVVDAGYHPGNFGDVQAEGILERCSAYTPVPGGVGPMTIATLMMQTVQAAELSCGLR
jgi:methylenetetrahydrofolate dehydrogenase (NADP+)/methenyltetrahydrofolate cyclohydrolase